MHCRIEANLNTKPPLLCQTLSPVAYCPEMFWPDMFSRSFSPPDWNITWTWSPITVSSFSTSKAAVLPSLMSWCIYPATYEQKSTILFLYEQWIQLRSLDLFLYLGMKELYYMSWLLFLSDKPPIIQWCKTTTFLFMLMVSLGQEFGKRTALRAWLCSMMSGASGGRAQKAGADLRSRRWNHWKLVHSSGLRAGRIQKLELPPPPLWCTYTLVSQVAWLLNSKEA